MNELMKFTDFRDYAKAEVVKYLPEELRGDGVTVMRFTKIGSAYYSMALNREEKVGRALVNLDESYERYADGESLESVVRDMADTLQEVYRAEELNSLTDYRFVRPRLFLRVSGRRWNQELLEDVPHRIAEDLALTSHILIHRTKSNVISTIIRKPLLEHFGITEEELFQETMKSAPILFPPKITLLKDVVFPDGRKMQTMHPDSAVLTNDIHINGASALFYPGMMEEAAAFMGGGYYAVPLSIHEMILTGERTDEALVDMYTGLQFANCRANEPRENLSNHIYHYDPVLKQFGTAELSEPFLRS